MPQIAQQDYLKIVGKNLTTDANLYAGLAKAIQAGTIFDVMLEHINGDNEIEQARVLCIAKGESRVYVTVYEIFNAEPHTIEIALSANNYLALAAVQAGGYGYSTLPLISTLTRLGEQVLVEDNSGGYVTCNGKCIIATIISGQFAALATSDITPPDGEPTYEIAESDFPYFIGLPEI